MRIILYQSIIIIINMTTECDCPICLEPIHLLNRATTECGHVFHCSCLLQHAARNHVSCPYCRTQLIEEQEQEEEVDEEPIIRLPRMPIGITDDSLITFRAFLADEVAEEQQDEEVEDNVEVEDEGPDPSYIVRRLFAWGFTVEDFVQDIILRSVHQGYARHKPAWIKKSSCLFGKIRAILWSTPRTRT